MSFEFEIWDFFWEKAGFYRKNNTDNEADSSASQIQVRKDEVLAPELVCRHESNPFGA